MGRGLTAVRQYLTQRPAGFIKDKAKKFVFN
jgi:hypothetical protein